MNLPPHLINAVQGQSAVLFLGAGASIGAKHPQGFEVPSGNKLRDILCECFLGGELTDRPLAEVAEYAINESSLEQVQTRIRELFWNYSPADFHKILPTFRWHGIASTNYDTIIEQSYEDSGDNRLQTLVPFVKNGESVETKTKKCTNGVQYLKLHGCVKHSTDAEIPFILSTEQYVKYMRNRTRLFERLKDWGMEFPIIFCGYSISDPNIQSILFDLFDEGQRRPTYYVVKKNIPDIEFRYWGSHRIIGIRGTVEEFLTTLDKAIPPTNRALDTSIGGGTSSIRSFYTVSGVAESQELLSFLSSDIDHIRPRMPVNQAKPKQFYKGYDEGWGAIAQDLDIPRSVSDSLVVEAILADEESRTDLVELYVLKGPGGNGKTIALKRAAWMAAHDYRKLVLFLRDGGAMRSDAIDEIFEHIGDRLFIFIDGAGQCSTELGELINRACKKSFKLTILTAERDAEWNVRCENLEPFVTKEFNVRYLSEREIRLLVDKLEEHGSLGVVANLDKAAQVQLFMEHAERQLLVALHEITLGKPFEEIIFDEYKRIIPDRAQRLYLDICTLNRLGVEVRAGLISRISGINFDDFQDQFFSPLENIVHSRNDKYIGDYVYRTRHRRVAQMVFDTAFTDPEDRFNQILYILRGMNIDYSSDREAFNDLVRAHGVVEAFPSQELGRKFYDAAVSMVGNEAFLFQQRGIFEMKHAGGSLVLAEEYLGKAASLEPYNPSIKHTQANLLRRQALESIPELQKLTLRERAKSMLNNLIGKPGERSYAHHTLASLALDNLKDALLQAGDEESGLSTRKLVDATREVELTLSSSLQKFPQNEHLLSLEASYRELINQNARAEQALKSAFEKNPRLDWVASRLTKKMIDTGKIEEAQGVLGKALTENPSSKRAHFEMAMFLLNHGKAENREKVVQHLRRSFTGGDSNHEAQYWYGRELFITGDFRGSAAVFGKLRNVRMAPKQKNRIRGRVLTYDGGTIFHDGRIVSLEDSYMFVECAEFPEDIFAHRSIFDDTEWKNLSVGSYIKFSVGFTMRGPVVASVKLQ